MGDIVYLDPSRTQSGTSQEIIDISKVAASRRKLQGGIILPPTEEIKPDIAEEHASEPIKSVEDINRISSYLLENKRYRDNMLFIVGINFGLRVSDLLQLRFCQLIDEDFSFKTTFPILEKKTRRRVDEDGKQTGRKVNKNRYITINDAVMDAVTIFLQHNPRRLDDFMFRSESNRGGFVNKPMSRMSVDRILKEIAETLDIHVRVATHTLRKTFGYHQMVMSGNDPRKLLLLQKIFGHSSSAQTLDYIGITSEEIEDAYLNLNLGGKNCYDRFSRAGEGSPQVGA